MTEPILYQYVSERAAQNILTNKQVGLRRQLDFNDPLEGMAAMLPEVLSMYRQADVLGPIRDAIGIDTYKELIESSEYHDEIQRKISTTGNCVVLCLTKQPHDPLMWAHYAGLSGYVIGYDTSSEFFTGTNNLCPIQYGEMIYTPNKPEDEIDFSETDREDLWFRKPFSEAVLTNVQRAFLYKADRWRYEREVRLVKRLNDTSEDAIRHEDQYNNTPLFLYDLPQNTIREVYRFYDQFRAETLRTCPWFDRKSWEIRNYIVDGLKAKFFAVTPKRRSWEFDVIEDPYRNVDKDIKAYYSRFPFSGPKRDSTSDRT